MKKVLIVDDSKINRKIIRAILSKRMSDIELIDAEDGFMCMDIIKTQEISVVILDIMMPGKDGIEVLREIKSNPEYKNIQVVMWSAITEIEQIEKALLLGALDYFTKPLTEEQMRITMPLKIKNALEYFEQKNQLIKFYENVKDEMQLAEQLQHSVISDHSIFDGVEVWGRYIPYQEIGGDIFCSKNCMNKTWFMMADVSGHGISAAMISTILSVVFNTSICHCKLPSEVLKTLNQTLFEVFRGSNYGLVSVFVGCIEGNILQYSNAGHPYPVFFKKSENKVEELIIKGLLLGIFEKEEFEDKSREINQDDLVILYTDGIFDKGKDIGYANWHLVREFCDLYVELLVREIPSFINNMIHYFEKVDGCNFVDDVAIQIIKKI